MNKIKILCSFLAINVGLCLSAEDDKKTGSEEEQKLIEESIEHTEKIVYETKPISPESEIIKTTAHNQNNEELGFIYYQNNHSGLCHIDRLLLYTYTLYQQDYEHVAFELFNKAIEDLKKDGCNKVIVEMRKNEIPNKFFEKLGIIAHKKEYGYYQGIYRIDNARKNHENHKI